MGTCSSAPEKAPSAGAKASSGKFAHQYGGQTHLTGTPADTVSQKTVSQKTVSQKSGSDNSSSFSSDVEHFIDVFIEAARSHFTQYWMWYSAAAIIAILICLMLCYRKQLTAMWKTMLEKRKETQSQSAEEEFPEEEENNRIEIVIVPNGSQPSSAVGQDLPMDFV